MSSWLVAASHNGTRFYIADNESETATDILARAKRFRWADEADAAAKRAEKEIASFGWASVRVAEEMV